MSHTLSPQRMGISSTCSESETATLRRVLQLFSCNMESLIQLTHGSCIMQTRHLPSNSSELVMMSGWATTEETSTQSAISHLTPRAKSTGVSHSQSLESTTHQHRLTMLLSMQESVRQQLILATLKDHRKCFMHPLLTHLRGTQRSAFLLLLVQSLIFTVPQVLLSSLQLQWLVQFRRQQIWSDSIHLDSLVS